MSAQGKVRQAKMLNLVARKTTYTPGYFYWFVRLPGPMNMGHMGWGFKGGDGVSYHCGSLENVSGWAIRGGSRYGDNWGGYWKGVVRGEEALTREMIRLDIAERALDLRNMSPYTYYKKTLVAEPNVGKAVEEAQKWASGSVWGFGTSYSVIAQNCLDNAREIALAYGVDRDLFPIRTGADAIQPIGFFNYLPGEQVTLYDEQAAAELQRVTATADEVDRLDAEWERITNDPGFPSSNYQAALQNQNNRLFAYRRLRDTLNQRWDDPAYEGLYNKYIYGWGRSQGTLDQSIRLLETR